jgi:hypothetical protein
MGYMEREKVDACEKELLDKKAQKDYRRYPVGTSFQHCMACGDTVCVFRSAMDDVTVGSAPDRCKNKRTR